MSPTRLRGAATGRRAGIDRDGRAVASRSPTARRTTRRRCCASSRCARSRRSRLPMAGGVRRSVRAGTLGAGPGWIEAEFAPAAPVVRLRFAPALAAASGRVVAAARRWLDLDAAPAGDRRRARRHPRRAGPAPAGQPRRVRARGARGARPAGHGRCGAHAGAAPRRALRRAARDAVARRRAHLPGARRRSPPRALEPSPSSASSAPAPPRSSHIAQAWPRARAADRDARSGAEPLIERLCAHRPASVLDRALHRDARARLARCLSAERRRRAEGDEPAASHDADQREADARAQGWQPWRAYAVLRLWNSLETTPP